MRVMVLLKGDPDPAAGEAPSEQMLREMGEFNEELADAGMLLAGEGLHHSSKGRRVTFSGDRRVVTDGPFAETKELVAGFWIWKVESMDHAVEWVKRIPNPDAMDTVVEIRPIYEAEDFGEAFTPELREKEERLRDRLAAQQ